MQHAMSMTYVRHAKSQSSRSPPSVVTARAPMEPTPTPRTRVDTNMGAARNRRVTSKRVSVNAMAAMVIKPTSARVLSPVKHAMVDAKRHAETTDTVKSRVEPHRAVKREKCASTWRHAK